MTLQLRRFETYLPAELLRDPPIDGSIGWLALATPAGPKRVAIDAATGRWLAVEPLVAPEEHGARVDAKRKTVVLRGGTEVRLPSAIPAAKAELQRQDGQLWLRGRWSRGAVRTRFARIDETSGIVRGLVELPHEAFASSATGAWLGVSQPDAIALYEEGVRVFSAPAYADGTLNVEMDAAHGVFAWTIAVRVGDEGHSVVTVSETSPLRTWTFMLAAGERVWPSLTRTHLALRTVSAIVVASLDDLRSLPPGRVEIVIDDVPTPAPSAELCGELPTGKVTMVGASTKIVFVEVQGVRKRVPLGVLDGVQVGDEVVVTDEDAQVVHHAFVRGAPRAIREDCRTVAAAPSARLDAIRQAAPSEPTRYPEPPPEAAFVSIAWSDAGLVDRETEKDVRSGALLGAADGVVELGGELLEHLLDDEIDGILSLVPVLRLDPTKRASKLGLCLEFWTAKAPSDAEQARLLEVATRLLDGGWGSNTEFELPSALDGYFVSPRGQATRVETLSRADWRDRSTSR